MTAPSTNLTYQTGEFVNHAAAPGPVMTALGRNSKSQGSFQVETYHSYERALRGQGGRSGAQMFPIGHEWKALE